MRGLYLGSRMIDGEPGVSPYFSPGDQVLKSERTLGIYKFMALQLARELGPGRARLSRAVNNTDIPGLWPLRYVFSVLRILLCAIKDALGVLAWLLLLKRFATFSAACPRRTYVSRCSIQVAI